MLYEIVDGSASREDDVQNAGDPYKLLCKCSCRKEVGPGKDQRHAQNEHKQYKGVGIQ